MTIKETTTHHGRLNRVQYDLFSLAKLLNNFLTGKQMSKKNTTSREYFSPCSDKECRGVWREDEKGLKPKSRFCFLRLNNCVEVYRGQPKFSQPITPQRLTPSSPPSLRSVGHSSFIVAPSDLSLSVGRSNRYTKREPTHWASPLDTCVGGVLLCQSARRSPTMRSNSPWRLSQMPLT